MSHMLVVLLAAVGERGADNPGGSGEWCVLRTCLLCWQLLANVAQIILEESEEGESVHTRLREMLCVLDLICCGAILFPVVWSVRRAAG